MSGRRWAALILGIVVIAAAVTVHALPELVRRLAVARLEAITQRPASIERVDLDLLRGRATVHGFRLAEREGSAPFVDFQRLDVRVRLPWLLVGHLWLRQVVLTDSTVHVLRLPTGDFNFSDLIRQSGSGGRALDVTVDRFALLGGTVTLEDRALPEPRTWVSEQISIEAHDLSTRRDDGRAIGRSVTGGAPVSVEVRNLRLYPIRLHATVAVENLDLAPAQVYVPPDAPFVLERGRASTSITVALDAREGIRVDATGRLDDVTLVSRDGGQRLARVPTLTTDLAGFTFREGADLRLERLALDGTVSVRDPRVTTRTVFRDSTVRARVTDLTWPATTPGHVDISTTIPGGGTLAVTGAIQPPPAASRLRLRLAGLDLAPWTQFLPVRGRVTGVAEADLRMNEPLAAGIPARLQGSIAVTRLALADDRRQVLGARRVEASGIEVHWPSRVVVERVLLTGPRATVERDRTGAFPVTDLVGGSGSSPTSPGSAAAAANGPTRAADGIVIDLGELAVRDGAIAWRDEAVSPVARLDVSSVNGSVTGVGWPVRGPAAVRLSLRPPGGGQVRLRGRVGVDPIWADLHVRATGAALAPYQPYLPTPARIAGAADLDLALAVPSLAEGRATARGRAAVSRVSVRDGERTVVRIERADASGIDVEWPERVAVGRLALAQPWVLVERDERGALTLRPLLSPASGPATPAGSTPGGDVEDDRPAPAIRMSQLTVEDGGMRVVDRAVSPPFAVDVQPMTVRMQGLSTASGPPARVELRGGVGPGAELTARGTVGPLTGPLRIDVAAEVREFAVPRANPYMLQQAGWKTTEGRLTSSVQARVDGDALSARTDIRISRLRLVRAAPEDGAQARIGLPLNMLTALMKDRRGNIRLSFPVGGTLGDPRFDFSEAIWSAIRTVAVNAITLPVSWIGRVRFTPDSRIERIEIDPVAFEPGASTPTPQGRVQATRLATFLEQLPDVRMALTPVISAQDLAAIKRRAVDAEIERVALEERLSREAAAARLFERTFPGRPAPGSLDSTLGALIERQPVPPSAAAELAEDRVEAVRTAVKEAGIDAARLVNAKAVEREANGGVELEVVAPETERPSRVREALRRLGVPLGAD